MKKYNHDSRTRFLTSILIVLLITPLNGCTNSKEILLGPSGSEVWMQGLVFDPVTITVTVNTTVKWTNMDSMDHTVTSDTHLFDSGNMTTGGTYSFTFATKGSFKYHCAYHPGMVGTVIVQ